MADTSKFIGFSITGITTEQFAIIEEIFKEASPVSLNTNLRFAIDQVRRGVSCFTLFQFEQRNVPFIKIEVGCHFRIKPDAWLNFATRGNDIIIPKGFMTHLGMMTVGTSRGILHAKTEGSRFNRFVIPTVNVSNMIKTDIVFAPVRRKLAANH